MQRGLSAIAELLVCIVKWNVRWSSHQAQTATTNLERMERWRETATTEVRASVRSRIRNWNSNSERRLRKLAPGSSVICTCWNRPWRPSRSSVRKCSAVYRSWTSTRRGNYTQGRIYSQLSPVQKNAGPSTGAADPIFPGKNWRPFLNVVITVRVSALSSPQKLTTFFCSSLSFHSGIAHFSGMQKFAAPFVGPLFVEPLFCRTCWTCLNPPLIIRHCYNIETVIHDKLLLHC